MATASSSIQELFSLKGQTALVTGGTRGIGQAMAIGLAEAGAHVVLLQRDTTHTVTKTQIESLSEGSKSCTIHSADLSSSESVTAAVRDVLAKHGRIHILLNCGGIQRRHKAEQFPQEDWNEVIQVNLSSVFALCRDIGAHMLEQEVDGFGRRGSIINVASLMSFQGGILVPAYAATKGGIASLTKALSNEWAGRGVNVNAIAPGYIGTDMTEALMKDEVRSKSIMERIPAGRWGKPEDFKGVIVFLASRASSYVTGEIMNHLALHKSFHIMSDA